MTNSSKFSTLGTAISNEVAFFWGYSKGHFQCLKDLIYINLCQKKGIQVLLHCVQSDSVSCFWCFEMFLLKYWSHLFIIELVLCIFFRYVFLGLDCPTCYIFFCHSILNFHGQVNWSTNIKLTELIRNRSNYLSM